MDVSGVIDPGLELAGAAIGERLSAEDEDRVSLEPAGRLVGPFDPAPRPEDGHKQSGERDEEEGCEQHGHDRKDIARASRPDARIRVAPRARPAGKIAAV